MVAVFTLLEARYLHLERGFRDLYDEVRLDTNNRRSDFRLKSSQNGERLLRAACSWSVFLRNTDAFMIVPLPYLGG